jgi:hypothetical protein
MQTIATELVFLDSAFHSAFGWTFSEERDVPISIMNDLVQVCDSPSNVSLKNKVLQDVPCSEHAD